MKALLTDRPRSALRQGGVALLFLTFLPLSACMMTGADLKMTERIMQQRIKQQEDQLSQTSARQNQEIASLREQELPQLRGELERILFQVQNLQAKQEGLKQQMNLLEQVVGKIERPAGGKKSNGTLANDLIGATSPEKAAVVNKLSNYTLPDFRTPEYDCHHYLRSVQVIRQPSSKMGAWDVFLQDDGGAEIKGDVVQSVGHMPESIITFNGTITIVPCQPNSGPRPIIIVGSRLQFELTAEGLLTYRDGSGSVNVGGKTTKLPLVTKPQ